MVNFTKVSTLVVSMLVAASNAQLEVTQKAHNNVVNLDILEADADFERLLGGTHYGSYSYKSAKYRGMKGAKGYYGDDDDDGKGKGKAGKGAKGGYYDYDYYGSKGKGKAGKGAKGYGDDDDDGKGKAGKSAKGGYYDYDYYGSKGKGKAGKGAKGYGDDDDDGKGKGKAGKASKHYYVEDKHDKIEKVCVLMQIKTTSLFYWSSVNDSNEIAHLLVLLSLISITKPKIKRRYGIKMVTRLRIRNLFVNHRSLSIDSVRSLIGIQCYD